MDTVYLVSGTNLVSPVNLHQWVWVAVLKTSTVAPAECGPAVVPCWPRAACEHTPVPRSTAPTFTVSLLIFSSKGGAGKTSGAATWKELSAATMPDTRVVSPPHWNRSSAILFLPTISIPSPHFCA